MKPAIFTLLGLAVAFGLLGIYPLSTSKMGGEKGADIILAFASWGVAALCFVVMVLLLFIQAMRT